LHSHLTTLSGLEQECDREVHVTLFLKKKSMPTRAEIQLVCRRARLAINVQSDSLRCARQLHQSELALHSRSGLRNDLLHVDSRYVSQQFLRRLIVYECFFCSALSLPTITNVVAEAGSVLGGCGVLELPHRFEPFFFLHQGPPLRKSCTGFFKRWFARWRRL